MQHKSQGDKIYTLIKQTEKLDSKVEELMLTYMQLRREIEKTITAYLDKVKQEV